MVLNQKGLFPSFGKLKVFFPFPTISRNGRLVIKLII